MLHPILAQMEPSPEQEHAIVWRGTDLVVTAGAGAGKTRTLVTRYLMLLSEGLPLRSVVAITFTRKAAREMRNRIREEMRRYLDGQEIGAEERERWQSLYSELDGARIGTIHSLCTEIIRGHPAELGIDPRFAVLEEGQANILWGQALDQALSWAANDEQVVELSGLMTERELRAPGRSRLRRAPAQDLGRCRSLRARAGRGRRLYPARQPVPTDAARRAAAPHLQHRGHPPGRAQGDPGEDGGALYPS